MLPDSAQAAVRLTARATPVRGDPCNDGLFCTTGETCSAGSCTGGGPTDCSDTEFCTADACDEGGDVCTHVPVDAIPGAEGPPPPDDNGTCSDTIDNDCDGAIDLDDPNCVMCTGNADCDDTNPCTDDVCNASSICVNTPAPGRPCDDGLACTDPDACTASGSCSGPAVDCSGQDDQCNVGQCSESAGGCIAVPANEGGACDDNQWCTVGETCQTGECLGSARDCSGAGDACNTGVCTEASSTCDPSPMPDNTPCTIDRCTANALCTGGICGGGSPVICDDTNTCTTDWCDPATGCQASLTQIDAASVVLAHAADPTRACMVAGTTGRLVVFTDLRDTTGAAITGATVTIGGLSATESTGQPGVYWVEIAAAAAPGTRAITVDASICAESRTLTGSVEIRDIGANMHAEGTAGCSPMDGNLRPRVVEQESGNPIQGASVLLGLAESLLVEHSPDSVFGGASTLATNVAFTDASGYVEYRDYAATLAGPATITAGAPGRVYVTIVDVEASDIILALPVPTTRSRPTWSAWRLATTTARTAPVNSSSSALISLALTVAARRSPSRTRT